MKKDLRVTLTKRLLREGLLRCMAVRTISKITVSELCKEAGVNRATFYNHYESPFDILREIANDYAVQLRKVYTETRQETGDGRASIRACLVYLMERREEIRILYSEHAENCIQGLGLSIISERLSAEQELFEKLHQEAGGDPFLYAVILSSSAYGLIWVWLTREIDKTPDEILEILETTFGGRLFSMT